MSASAAEAVLALTASVECWGGHRRTAPAQDQWGPDGLLGCSLEMMGLLPTVPVADRMLHATVEFVVASAPQLAAALSPGAVAVLQAAGLREHEGKPWRECARAGRETATDLAVTAEATTAPAPSGPEVPDGTQVVRLQHPRRDGQPPCPVFSGAVMLLGGTAVAFGCALPAEHAANGHRFTVDW